MTTPKPPADLKTAGRALWRSVLADLELDEHETALLRAACRTTDRLEDLAAAMEGAPLTVTNSRGDEVASPLLVEHRNQAQSLAKTLASLRLPSGLAADGELVRPQRRGAARAAYGIRGAVS
ncbi:hypothetical protein [Janibacter melonis]|uniref:hypothetical protein n=1 Tax=Janibacter melonis TaxID=262209 RepID=UPI00174A65F4|nr:hypothetical protein [Janibacter melonis]